MSSPSSALVEVTKQALARRILNLTESGIGCGHSCGLAGKRICLFSSSSKSPSPSILSI